MTAVESVEKPKRVSHPSHRPWKSLRDFHIPTASTISSYEKARPNSRAHRINNFGWAKLNRRSGPSALAKRTAGGGGVVATYETSLYDEWGVRRSDFGLSNLFGASYDDALDARMQNSYLRLESAAEFR